ncbi:MAG: DUF86 domain-containing protein [Lachnospiraceae bacterium]|nr:DUF86 domain-containing protein [Lachnospiraceae bacterium]
MNEKTKIIYNMSRMYEYARDAIEICRQNDFQYEQVIENMVSKHAVNMCIVQMGEHAARIRDIDSDFYKGSQLGLYQIKGMRDRITHSYGEVDYAIVKHVLEKDIPAFTASVEAQIPGEILENPYLLFEMEYDEYLKKEIDGKGESS